uniref:Uncharacterized protein n=1 Tax=Arundo donax TaxID=35708 RepID=A0A0A9CV86_ARUDO
MADLCALSGDDRFCTPPDRSSTDLCGWGGWWLPWRASPAEEAREGKEDADLRLDPRVYDPAAAGGGGMSFSAGADERRWILLPTPTPGCRRCADGAAAAESRRQRDRLLWPHCSSTSPTPAPPPVELGEAVSEESEGWWCAWSRAGLRPADDGGGGCGARARNGLDSNEDAPR